MKFRSAPLLLPALLWLGLALAAVTPASAGPLKSIGSGLKKVGNALTPWKKEEPSPAPAPSVKPAKAAPKAKPVAKAAPAKPKTKPVAVAQKKKSSTGSGSDSTTVASNKKKLKTATGGTTAAAAAGAAGATGPEAPNDSTKEASTPPETTPAADSLPTSVPASAAPIPLAELPFGTPIMGKKGYVRSPFAPEDGLVDVTGINAGTKVKCPFSGKVFRVP